MSRQILTRVCNSSLNFNRTFLSSSFKEAVSKRLEFPDLEGPDLQSFLSAKQPTAISLDYLSRVAENEDRVDLRYLLSQLRSTDQASKLLESTNHSVITHFVKNGNAREFLPILLDRANYGIFINNITACYLMDHLLQAKDYLAAAQTAVVSIVYENLDNALVHALALKSCYEYLNELARQPVVPEAIKDPKEKIIEKKVRVKYLRNSNSVMDINNSFIPLIGKTLLMADKSSEDIRFNMKVIGLVLCKQYTEIAKKGVSETNLVHKDIANICLALIPDKNEVPVDFLSLLESEKDMNSKIDSFESKLTLLINKAVQSQEPILIENHQEMFAKWADDRRATLDIELKAKTTNLRKTKIDKILTELNTKKQQLWYFSSEDKIELEIYRNRTTFPKKWFGKKKNPKVVDDFYIPPEV